MGVHRRPSHHYRHSSPQFCLQYPISALPTPSPAPPLPLPLPCTTVVGREGVLYCAVRGIVGDGGMKLILMDFNHSVVGGTGGGIMPPLCLLYPLTSEREGIVGRTAARLLSVSPVSLNTPLHSAPDAGSGLGRAKIAGTMLSQRMGNVALADVVVRRGALTSGTGSLETMIIACFVSHRVHSLIHPFTHSPRRRRSRCNQAEHKLPKYHLPHHRHYK